MKLFQKASDGGKDSGVTAWFLITAYTLNGADYANS